MDIDYKTLGRTLAIARLAGKPVDQYSQAEVDTLVRACVEAVAPDLMDSGKLPHLNEEGHLVLDPHKTIYETLQMLSRTV